MRVYGSVQHVLSSRISLPQPYLVLSTFVGVDGILQDRTLALGAGLFLVHL